MPDPTGPSHLDEERRRLYEKLRGRGSPGCDSPPPGAAGGCLVEMKPTGSLPPLFFVHALFGSVFPYHKVALHLPADLPLVGVEARGLDGKAEPRDRIPEMAAAYVAAIRAACPRGPYHLAGYSFGAWVAWEMAAHLARAGEQVGAVAIIGVGVPPTVLAPEWAPHLDSWGGYLSEMQRLFGNLALAEGQVPPWGHPPAAWRVASAHGLASMRYLPEAAPLAVHLVATMEQAPLLATDPTLGWGILAAAVDTRSIECNHLALFQDPHVQHLATLLGELVARHGSPP